MSAFSYDQLISTKLGHYLFSDLSATVSDVALRAARLRRYLRLMPSVFGTKSLELAAKLSGFEAELSKYGNPQDSLDTYLVDNKIKEPEPSIVQQASNTIASIAGAVTGTMTNLFGSSRINTDSAPVSVNKEMEQVHPEIVESQIVANTMAQAANLGQQQAAESAQDAMNAQLEAEDANRNAVQQQLVAEDNIATAQNLAQEAAVADQAAKTIQLNLTNDEQDNGFTDVTPWAGAPDGLLSPIQPSVTPQPPIQRNDLIQVQNAKVFMPDIYYALQYCSRSPVASISEVSFLREVGKIFMKAHKTSIDLTALQTGADLLEAMHNTIDLSPLEESALNTRNKQVALTVLVRCMLGHEHDPPANDQRPKTINFMGSIAAQTNNKSGGVKYEKLPFAQGIWNILLSNAATGNTIKDQIYGHAQAIWQRLKENIVSESPLFYFNDDNKTEQLDVNLSWQTWYETIQSSNQKPYTKGKLLLLELGLFYISLTNTIDRKAFYQFLEYAPRLEYTEDNSHLMAY